MRGVKVRTTVAKKHRLNAKLKKQADEDQTHVHLGHYLAYVRTELDQEASCLEMPWTMILLLSFAVVMFMHLRPDQVLVVENAWKTDIEENANFAWSEHFGHKTVYDVDSIPDFWAWLRLGMLPLLGNTWLWSEGLDAAYAATPFSTPDLPTVLDLSYGIFADEPWGNASLPVRGDFLHFNRIVAGVRLQQERAIGSWEACHVPTSMPEDLWKRWLGKPCMLATPSYFLRPEVHWAHSFHSPQRVEWMLSGSLQELQQMTLDMEEGCARGGPCRCQTCQGGAQTVGGASLPAPWLDEYTQRVELSTVAYNQNYGLLSKVTVNFFFNRAGRIQALVEVQTGRLSSYSGHILSVITTVFCDVIWMLGWLKLLAVEAREIVNTITGSNNEWWKALLFEYVAFWNIIDWLSMACSFAVVGTYIRVQMEAGAASEVLTAAQNGTSAQDAQAAFEAAESFIDASADFSLALLFFPMLVMLRLFKSFHAQPRLAIVTKTLTAASQDLLHFFIVLASVYLCMAAAAVLIFGEDLEEFSTLDRSAITCFRALLGEYSWDEMSSVGRVLAGTWLWGFVLLVDLVLLNMVLAILMDAYGAVKSHASVMTTVPHQISEMLRRRRLTREKKRVRLSDIWFAYLNKFKDAEEMLASQAMVMPEDLVKQVPGLQMAQAKRTMSHAMMQQDDNDSRYGVHQMGLQIKMCNMRAKILQEEVLAIRSALEEVRLAAEPLPSPSHLGLKESTVRIVEILKTSVGGLRDQVDGVLQDEMQIHEMRQYQLQDEQRAMRLCAQDAKAKLKAMLRRLEGLSTTLEKHVTKEQVTSVFGNGRPQEGVSLARSLAVCSEPTRGQVTMS